jgi:hypothetical protein
MKIHRLVQKLLMRVHRHTQAGDLKSLLSFFESRLKADWFLELFLQIIISPFLYTHLSLPLICEVRPTSSLFWFLFWTTLCWNCNTKVITLKTTCVIYSLSLWVGRSSRPLHRDHFWFIVLPIKFLIIPDSSLELSSNYRLRHRVAKQQKLSVEIVAEFCLRTISFILTGFFKMR